MNLHLRAMGVTSHIASHSVTCHPTQVNTCCLNPARGWYSIYFPWGMDGWVDL